MERPRSIFDTTVTLHGNLRSYYAYGPADPRSAAAELAGRIGVYVFTRWTAVGPQAEYVGRSSRSVGGRISDHLREAPWAVFGGPGLQVLFVDIPHRGVQGDSNRDFAERDLITGLRPRYNVVI